MQARIMVVDDAAFMRELLKNMLVTSGFEVVAEGCNGVQAVHLYKRVKPDLVIMDITMPEMNGIDALEGIREHDPQAKVIMCSAMGQKKFVIEAIKSGAKDFIVKPFNKDRITDAIKNILFR